MIEPRWITLEAANLLHELQITEFGGSHGVRDIGLLDSAMARPKNLFLYEAGVPLSRLAATYCYGISRNHPFVDGNKRVAYVVARIFLQKIGHDIVATTADKIDTMLALARGELSETELANWFSTHTAPLD